MQNCFRVCFRFIFLCFGFTLSCFVLLLPYTGLYRANSQGLREKEKRNGIIHVGLCNGMAVDIDLRPQPACCHRHSQ